MLVTDSCFGKPECNPLLLALLGMRALNCVKNFREVAMELEVKQVQLRSFWQRSTDELALEAEFGCG